MDPYVLAGLGIGAVVTVCAAPAALGVVGFGSAGPVASTLAAGWQASIGSVAAGSAFATVQSMAMGGAVAGTVQAVAAGTGATLFGAAVYVGRKATGA
ncbi:hypothetical protein MMC25_004057 [Agyrium rufum]|nr:hypothetical protein [Agyrium rufum]